MKQSITKFFPILMFLTFLTACKEEVELDDSRCAIENTGLFLFAVYDWGPKKHAYFDFTLKNHSKLKVFTNIQISAALFQKQGEGVVVNEVESLINENESKKIYLHFEHLPDKTFNRLDINISYVDEYNKIQYIAYQYEKNELQIIGGSY